MAKTGILRHVLSYWYPELNIFASLENPNTPLSAVFEERKTASGQHVTEERSLAIGAVLACVKVISETLAQMDLEVVETVNRTTRPNTTHPNYWLLYAEPSPYYNAFEWKQGMCFYVLLWGNAYSWIKRDRFANAKELKILPPWEVSVRMTERGKLFYEWRTGKETKIILSEDMLHVKNLGADGIVGLSTIELYRESLGNSLSKIEFEGSFYQNGAKADGILMMPGTLGPTEQQNVRESFNDATQGARNKHKTIVLEEGVRYQQLTIPQGDAQFLESKKFDQTEIAGIFRVPPHKIGNLQDANFSNIDSQERSFAKNTMVPWTIRFQQEIDRKIFFPEERRNLKSQFNLDDLIKGDIETRYKVWNIGIQSGIIKPTEVRESEGWTLEGTEQIDKFFMNGTMKAVGEEPTQPPMPDNNNQNDNQNAA